MNKSKTRAASKPQKGNKAASSKQKQKKIRPKDRIYVSQPHNNAGKEDVEVDMAVDVEGVFGEHLDIKGMTRTRQSLKKEHRLSRPKEKRKVHKFEFEKDEPLSAPVVREGGDDEEGEKLSDLDEDDFAVLGSDLGSDDLSVYLSDVERGAGGLEDGLLEDGQLDHSEDDDSGLSTNTIDSDDVDGMKLDSDFEEQGDLLKMYLETLNNPDGGNSYDGVDEDAEEEMEVGPEEEEEEDSEVEKEEQKQNRKKPVLGPSAEVELRHERKGGSKIYRVQQEEEEELDAGESLRKPLPVKRDGRFVFMEDSSAPASKRRKVLLDKMKEPDTNLEAEATGPSKADELGSRWGRRGIKDILQIKDKTERMSIARGEIAILGREIVADPENSLNYLKRLSALTGRTFLDHTSENSEKHVPIEIPIRALAILSLLAVLLDIIPGYRIRPLTDLEKAAKVSQIVQRQRDWEDGLLKIYRNFIAMCEKEIKEKTKLEGASIKCLCDLMKEKTYFNFSQEVMEVLTKRISSRHWDQSSEICLSAITSVFESPLDQSFSSSLSLVRLLSKSIRARSFSVNPKLLSCMLSLQLHDAAKGEIAQEGKPILKNREKAKKKEVLSKKARKTKKEQDKIQKEIEVAELTVDAEERSRNVMETLKALFALYFRIVKLPNRTPLLPPALEGLARFGHLVNVDFFKDLMTVLSSWIRGTVSEPQQEGVDAMTTNGIQLNTKEKLLCIVTAFQLLSGQGEALNIDLTEFSTCLYGLLPSLALSSGIEDKVDRTDPKYASAQVRYSESQLLFRALHAIFFQSRLAPSPTRTLAFTKRLLLSALHWPPSTIVDVLEFLKKMLVKESRLAGMLDTSDRKGGSVWKGEAEVEWESGAESTVWWELALLQQTHYDARVRRHASELAMWNEASR
ncbi:NOC3p-domain-containing protein [Atractiella rhizophila]|nr:NOC3p-domain-containing protein [Atractiella rhizophila]